MNRLQQLPKYVILAGILPMDRREYDVVSKDVKTVKDFHENKPQMEETGWDRLKQMFRYDETEGISSELNAIQQAGLCGILIGSVYGGVITSRKAYLDFMENNMATAFKSHLDAKKQLQDRVTLSFAKGAFRWGWRLGLFTTSYVGIITCISVYREKSSIYEYLLAGGITGAVYKLNLGLRGAAAGGIIGGVFGGIAGCISLLVMKLSGTSMEEVRYWQYKWKLARNNAIRQSFKTQAGEEPELIKHHDGKFGGSKAISLDQIDEEKK